MIVALLFVLNFRYVASFGNQSQNEGKRGQISHFCHCQSWEGASEMRMCVSIFRSSAFPRHVLDFRYVAPFQNQSAAKATGVENRS